MESSGWKATRFGLALLGAGLFLNFAAPSAAAQNRIAQPSAGDDVARHLRTLASNPRSVAALMGAGKASLAVGDAQAALTFFARAEELLPQDGRIKMWMGSALVQLEQPRPALRFFEEARSLGVSEQDFAGDRGLVHDMLGDPRRAQRDYELALRNGAGPEITRRLALSLAITGERERALQLLEEQLLVRDPAAERTRALVLALTGDAAGAVRLTQAAMPGPQADAMAPFLARLPSLSMAERAMAVHFGHFPGEGRPDPSAAAYASLEPVTSAGAPDPAQPALGTRTASAEPSAAPRRRPDTVRPATGTEQASSQPVRAAAAPPQGHGAARQPAEKPAAKPAVEQPPVVLAQRDPEPEPRASQAAAEEAERERSRLADLAATLEAIGEDEPVAAPPPRPRPATTPARTPARQPAAGATTRGAAASAAKKPAPAREPSRVWVQVAGGADKAALPREFTRLKAKAPRLLGSRTAWTVPVNATNRLLVGPFASSREAQSFINELAKADVAGFAWTSAAGQKVERLPAR